MKKECEKGFTLIEVLAVIIILASIAAIAIPKLTSSTENARRKADIATAHEVKAALDRYQVEHGVYPTSTELTAEDGVVTCTKLIPIYISKLDTSTTQQMVSDTKKGFGLDALAVSEADTSSYVIPASPTISNVIMIYLTDNGAAAEVQAYDGGTDKVLWTSAN